MTSAAILLSRQSLFPANRFGWIHTVESAMQYIANRKFTVFTSTGMQTWEILIYLASILGVMQKIVIPVFNGESEEDVYTKIKIQFDLSDSLVEFVPFRAEKDRQRVLIQRDTIVSENADLLIPVSIRKGGGMEMLVKKAALSGRTFDYRFQIPYRKKTESLKYALDEIEINPALFEFSNEYIFHWTRASVSAWPDENLKSFYGSLLKSNNYPRDAFSTLKNILASRCICASSRHMASGEHVVSFTGHSPQEFMPFMRWRKRYNEMSFEPYGIGIKRSKALAYGFEPVIYSDKIPKNDGLHRWLYQTSGRRGNWLAEKEYRCSGSVHLDNFDIEDIIAICFHEDEALEINKLFKIQAVWVNKSGAVLNRSQNEGV